jgi:hypothetical protein
LTACPAGPADKPAGPRPGGPVQPCLRPALTHAPTARSPRAGRSCGRSAGGEVHPESTSEAPGRRRASRAGVVRTRAAGRREESSGTVAFTSGEEAPVVVVECDEVLHLGRGKGVRKLQEITRIGGSGRSSPGNDGRWQPSVGIRAREGLPVAGGGGPGTGSGVESVALERGVWRGVGDGGADGVRARFERSVGSMAEREKGRERGGSSHGSATWRGAASWGLAPTGGRCPAAAPARHARVAGRKQRGGS